MTYSVTDPTTRSAWSAAAHQTAQLTALAAVWSGNVTVRYYTAGGTHVGTATHAGWSAIDTGTTPYSIVLGALSAWSYLQPGTAAYCVCAVPGGADILRADVSLAGAVGAAARVNLGSTSGAAGLRLYADSGLPLSGVPAWLSAATVGEWSSIASSSLTASGAGWTGTHPGGSGNYQTLVTTWGGAILNTAGIYRSGSFVAGTFLILFGGGHGDYAGNEVMAFGPFESDAPTWSRITDPTIPAPTNVGRLGGYPVSRHTYDTLVYLPSQNQMLCIGAPGYYNVGSSFNQADVFDFDTDPSSANPWSTADPSFPNYPLGIGGTINLLSGWDGTSAWGIGPGNSQQIGRYTPGSGWTSWAINNPDGPSNSKGACILGGSVLAYCTSTGALRAVDLRSTPAVYTPATTGTGPTGRVAMEWDDAGGRFVAWEGSGKTLFFLAPGANPYSGGDAWTWSSSTPAGGITPTTQTTNGTFGRFRVFGAGSSRCVLAMPTQSSGVHFYRMA